MDEPPAPASAVGDRPVIGPPPDEPVDHSPAMAPMPDWSKLAPNAGQAGEKKGVAAKTAAPARAEQDDLDHRPTVRHRPPWLSRRSLQEELADDTIVTSPPDVDPDDA